MKIQRQVQGYFSVYSNEPSKFEISKVHTNSLHKYGAIKNLSLWQRLNSFV